MVKFPTETKRKLSKLHEVEKIKRNLGHCDVANSPWRHCTVNNLAGCGSIHSPTISTRTVSTTYAVHTNYSCSLPVVFSRSTIALHTTIFGLSDKTPQGAVTFSFLSGSFLRCRKKDEFLCHVSILRSPFSHFTLCASYSLSFCFPILLVINSKSRLFTATWRCQP